MAYGSSRDYDDHEGCGAVLGIVAIIMIIVLFFVFNSGEDTDPPEPANIQVLDPVCDNYHHIGMYVYTWTHGGYGVRMTEAEYQKECVNGGQ